MSSNSERAANITVLSPLAAVRTQLFHRGPNTSCMQAAANTTVLSAHICSCAMTVRERCSPLTEQNLPWPDVAHSVDRRWWGMRPESTHYEKR
eukprot:2316440-Prymnesium_polylepis.1